MAQNGPALPILFLHIGWARDYRGAKDDLPQGTFGYILDGNDDAGEALNFKRFNGRCFGYAPARTINMNRLGGDADDDHVDGVLVVWTATAPDRSGRFVVGWYKNARVFAEMSNVRPHKISWVVCEAAAVDCHMVPMVAAL